MGDTKRKKSSSPKFAESAIITKKPSSKAKKKLTHFELTSPFNPPSLFARVRKGLYRSRMIKPSHLDFIAQCQLKCIVNLSIEAPQKAVIDYLRKSRIQLINLGLKAWRDTTWEPVNVELVAEALEITLSGAYNPCLVMCASGYRITGVVVGCLRKVENWTFSSITDEFRRFAGHHMTYSALEFIENFDCDLVDGASVDIERRAKEAKSLGSKSVLAPRATPPLLSPGVVFSWKKTIKEVED
mmetsp:Transcript_23480/g.45867  ORF Transcript_23480/g.45867 Transcript_23480/m.45867 type:complete len:242 (+) Transcript_23480:25-750(+)